MFQMRLLKSKDNASQGTRLRRGVHLRYRTVSTSWLRNIILIPFRDKRGQKAPKFTQLSCRLGPANPCPIAVHMEPFSTSVFKVLI